MFFYCHYQNVFILYLFSNNVILRHRIKPLSEAVACFLADSGTKAVEDKKERDLDDGSKLENSLVGDGCLEIGGDC